MANYTINNAGSTTCNYPSTVGVGDVLTFNITNTTITTKYRGSMLTYTFPCDCTAEILAAGAKGGDGAGGGAGGRGAIVAGTLSFKTGDQLLICVGQAGTNSTLSSGSDGTTGAGGGGTYVVRKVSNSSYRYTASGTGYNWYVEPLVIGAGGNGGGDNLWSGNVTIHANSSNGNENGFSYAASYYGGGFSNCAVTDYSSTTGRSFLTGAQGATDAYNRGGTSYAGFGGGGGNEDDGEYGGGGGGFTGGYAGTGATSYVTSSASNISRKSSSSGNNGEGYVKITFKTVVPLHEIPDGFVEKIKEFNTQVKVDNAWKSSDKSFVKVDNAWKEINKMYTKVNNSWVETGKNTFYHNNWVIHEGYISDSMFYEGWIGNATYSLYTPGEGITLYTAGGTYNQYPVAIGAISSAYWIITYKDTWKVSFQRTSGNTEFEIGVALVTDTSILTTGRLNTTSFNSITKKHGQRFNVNNGVFTFCPAELFGEEYEEELYDFNTYIAFYLYSPTNASTTIKITSALECFPIHCVMHEGVLEDTSMTGNYTGHSTYSPYSSGTGISLYKASGTSYPISIGCFNAPMDAKKIYAIDIAYEVVGTTVPNASLGFAYFNSQYNGRTASSGPTTVQTRFTTASPIDKLQGSVSLYIENITDYTTLENVYFAVFLNSTEYNSVTVKIKGIYFYISDDLELGGGEQQPSSNSIFPVKNVQVYNNTEFGALTTGSYVTDSSGSMGIKVVTAASNLYANTTRFSFDKKFDMSKIEKIIMKWAYSGSVPTGTSAEVFVGCTSVTYNTRGNTNYTGQITQRINLSQGQNVIETIEFVPSNWSGEYYLSIGICPTTNTALTIGIVELEIVLKDNTGGGATQTATLRLSDMYSADLYSSDWLNISSAYDNSSTTYAYLVLNGIITNYQALIFNSNGIALNSANITKATLYLDAIYYLTSGSGPNVGVTVRSMGQNDIIKNIQEFHDITTTTVIDITSYISNSINYSGNVELVFETYNMNSSGVLGQIRMHEAYIELEYSEGGGSSTPQTIKLLENGVVNTSTRFGNYSAQATYAKYAEGTGITLYKSASSSYPYSVGYFATKAKVSSLKSFTVEYERTAGSGAFYIGICAHATAGTSGRLATANFKFSNTEYVTANSGTVTIDTSELGLVTDDCYLGIFVNQASATSHSVLIKNISYIDSEASGGSSGSDYYIVRNGAYETTNVFKRQFLMGTGDWVDTVVPNSNGNLKFNLTTGTNNNNQCVVYYYTDTIDVTNYNKLVIDASFSYSTSRGDGIAVGIGTLYEYDDTVYVEPDPDSYLTTGNNLQNGINEIDISNITGDRVICMQVMSGSYSGSAAINIYMKDLYLTVAGGSTGGGTGSGTGLTITQGYIEDGDYVTSSNYESIVTEKVNVKSLSNTTSFAFTVTSSTYVYAKAYFEVWSSDGTQGTFVGYAELGYYDFSANSPTPITISKNELAYDLDLSSGYDIGHVALSLYADPIYAQNFTITFGSGVQPKDDI